MTPKIIGISGPSGCGKTTVANTLRTQLGKKNCLILSTDDLHKYERNSFMWDTVTHFNPEANNIELGDEQLLDLKRGKSVWRSTYCHKTGTFNAPEKCEPHKFIINEGLHALYSAESLALTDVKIYVETDPELTKHWKIVRDTKHRDQNKKVVLERIKMRENDLHFIECQKNSADFVIYMFPTIPISNIGNEYETIELDTKIFFGAKEIEFTEFLSKIIQ